MADANSITDTQVLLQSMLQRLRLQPRPESNSTHMQHEGQFGRTFTQNGTASQSLPQTPPMHNLYFSMDGKSVVTNRAGSPSPGSIGGAANFRDQFSQGIGMDNCRKLSTPKQRTQSWDYRSNYAVAGENSDVSTHANDGGLSKQGTHRLFSLKKKKSNSSVSSLQSLERLFPSTHTSGQMESSIRNQKKWTQKVKDKWKERHKSTIKRERDDREKPELSVSNSIISPIPVQNMPHENNTIPTFNEDVNVQHRPINTGAVEDIPSRLDHMSEALFSPGSFNLMEEIFTGQEWARFLPSSTDSQLASSSITHDQEIGLRSSINQLHHNEQKMLSQWNFRGETGTDVGTTQSQINAGGFYTMEATESAFSQRNTPSFSQVSQNSWYSPPDSGSNHLKSMDLSVSPLGINHIIQEQTDICPYNQSNNAEPNVSSSLSTDDNVNQLQTMEMNHHQHGSAQKVLPVLDLSYLKPKDSVSLKAQLLLSRKRSHSIERRGSNEQWRWRNNSSSSTSDPAPSLSPASSISSLQYSISEESESVATETVIKKRRVENTRRVRFAEEVTIVPPLFLSDDEGEAEDDEECGHNSNMLHDVSDDGEEGSPPRTSVPRWIEALRSKTKNKPKLTLPRMRTKKYRFV